VATATKENREGVIVTTLRVLYPEKRKDEEHCAICVREEALLGLEGQVFR
jgi:hypothetical protein